MNRAQRLRRLPRRWPKGRCWEGRFVAPLSPVFAIAAGWLAGVGANVAPDANLDQTQVTAFMVTASTTAFAAVWKWLQGWH